MSYCEVPFNILLKIGNSYHVWPFFIFHNKDTCHLTLSSRHLWLSAWDSRKVFISFETLSFSLWQWTSSWEVGMGSWHLQSQQTKIVNFFFLQIKYCIKYCSCLIMFSFLGRISTNISKNGEPNQVNQEICQLSKSCCMEFSGLHYAGIQTRLV